MLTIWYDKMLKNSLLTSLDSLLSRNFKSSSPSVERWKVPGRPRPLRSFDDFLARHERASGERERDAMGAHLSPTQTLAANERSNKACSTMAGALLRIAFLVFIFFGGAKGRSSLELPRAYVYNGQNKHDPYAAMLYDEMKTDLDMEDEEEGDYDIKDEDYDGLEYSGEIGVCLLQYLNRYTCPTQPEECESVRIKLGKSGR